MKSESFIAVYDWMLALPLNCREAMVYAVIYGFSRRVGSYTGGQAYLAERLKITRQTVNLTLRKLTETGLLLKRDIYRHGIRYCEYKINPDTLPEAPMEEPPDADAPWTNCPAGQDKMSGRTGQNVHTP